MPRKRRDSDEDSERGAASRRAPMYAVLARELLRHLGDTLPGVASAGRGDPGRTAALRGDGHAGRSGVAEDGTERAERRIISAVRVLRGGDVDGGQAATAPQPAELVEEARAARLRGPRLVSDERDTSNERPAERPARIAGSFG